MLLVGQNDSILPKDKLAIYVKAKMYILFNSVIDEDPGLRDPCVVAAINKLTRTTEVLWRKRDSMACLLYTSDAADDWLVV